MPERIATAEIRSLDTETIEIDDAFPGAYGFHVSLDCDPGPEWALEFETVYQASAYPGKPPVVFQGDKLCVFYLPRYLSDMPKYLRFLQAMITKTNDDVRRRNAVLPNEEAQLETFRQKLRELTKSFPQGNR